MPRIHHYVSFELVLEFMNMHQLIYEILKVYVISYHLIKVFDIGCLKLAMFFWIQENLKKQNLSNRPYCQMSYIQ